MSDILCVTDRRRMGDLRGFLARVEEIAAADIDESLEKHYMKLVGGDWDE